MEMCWTTGRQDSGDRYDKEGVKDSEEGDNEEDNNGNKEEDNDKEDQDEDEDEPTLYPNIDISNWDLLGKDFECKAANLGLYSPYELSTQLTMF